MSPSLPIRPLRLAAFIAAALVALTQVLGATALVDPNKAKTGTLMIKSAEPGKYAEMQYQLHLDNSGQ